MAALASDKVPIAETENGELEAAVRHSGKAPQTDVERDLCLILPDEEAPLAELKLKLKDLLTELPQHSDLVGDLRLVRFLRGHGSPEAADAAYREAMAFRKEAGIEEIRQKYFPDSSKVDFLISSIDLPHAELVREIAGTAIILGRCDDGDLCMLMDTGGRNISRVEELVPEEKLTEFFHCFLEARMVALEAESRKLGKLVKCKTVWNLGEVGLWFLTHVSTISMMTRLIKGAAILYPESLESQILIKSPSVVSTLFALFTPVLNERVKRKIEFQGYDYHARVEERFGKTPLETLEEELKKYADKEAGDA